MVSMFRRKSKAGGEVSADQETVVGPYAVKEQQIQSKKQQRAAAAAQQQQQQQQTTTTTGAEQQGFLRKRFGGSSRGRDRQSRKEQSGTAGEEKKKKSRSRSRSKSKERKMAEKEKSSKSKKSSKKKSSLKKSKKKQQQQAANDSEAALDGRDDDNTAYGADQTRGTYDTNSGTGSGSGGSGMGTGTKVGLAAAGAAGAIGLGAYFANNASFDTQSQGGESRTSRTTELELEDDDKSRGSQSEGRLRRSLSREGKGGWGSMFKARSTEDDDISNIEVVYKEFGEDAGSLLKLVLHDAIPEPINKDDVVVRVEASTVGLTDCIIRRGMWYESIATPVTPGFDLVGTVHSVGTSVHNFMAGDRVAALVRTGGNARYATVPASSLVIVPSDLDPTKAVSIISTYMTAFQALDAARAERDSLKGLKVLITGGNGAMGQALIELAKWAGCTDIYASASEKYHARLKYGLGATCLPSDPRLWLPEVKGQMDVVVDSICRDGYESPQKALAEGGQLVCIGVTSILYTEDGPGMFGPPAKAVWASTKAKMFMRNTTTYEVWESFQSDPEKFKDDLEYLFQMLRNGQVKPNVVQRVRLSEVAEAHRTIESCGVSGQIVCLPWKKFAYRKPAQQVQGQGATDGGGNGNRGANGTNGEAEENGGDKKGGLDLMCCR